jgi:hypothetical protein
MLDISSGGTGALLELSRPSTLGGGALGSLRDYTRDKMEDEFKDSLWRKWVGPKLDE